MAECHEKVSETEAAGVNVGMVELMLQYELRQTDVFSYVFTYLFNHCLSMFMFFLSVALGCIP